MDKPEGCGCFGAIVGVIVFILAFQFLRNSDPPFWLMLVVLIALYLIITMDFRNLAPRNIKSSFVATMTSENIGCFGWFVSILLGGVAASLVYAANYIFVHSENATKWMIGAGVVVFLIVQSVIRAGGKAEWEDIRAELEKEEERATIDEDLWSYIYKKWDYYHKDTSPHIIEELVYEMREYKRNEIGTHIENVLSMEQRWSLYTQLMSIFYDDPGTIHEEARHYLDKFTTMYNNGQL